MHAVIDASAVIALILGEPGAESVAEAIADCAITTVNLAEVVGYFARNGASEPAIREIIDALRMQTVPFDRELALAAGVLLPSTRGTGLSLGDRACLALGRRLGLKAITTDRAWLRVAQVVGVDVELLR